MNLGLLLLSGGLWGLHFALMRMLGASASSVLLALFPLLVGVAICLVGSALLFGGFVRPTWTHLRFWLIAGVLGYLIPFLLELVVAPRIETGLLTFAVTTVPLFTIVLVGIFRTEISHIRQWIAVGIGLAAAAMLFLSPNAIPDADMAGWTLLAFTIPVFYAAQALYIVSAWPPDLSPVQAAAGESVVSAALMLPYFLTTYDHGAVQPLLAGWPVLLATIVVTAGEVLSFFALTRLAGAIYVSFTSFTALAAGIVWGYLLFDEIPTVMMGVSCVIMGVALVILVPSKRAE